MSKKKLIRNWHRKKITKSISILAATVLICSISILASNTAAMTNVIDTTPPASITNLANISTPYYINWTWTDPKDTDFSKVKIYLDGKFKKNVTKGKQYYNATNLLAGTQHTISTKTVDTSGNVNKTWVNNTALAKYVINQLSLQASQPIKHVMVIVFENKELNNVLSNGPYFKYLYDTYGTATNYYGACHPSASNYLAMTSGKTWECGSDSVNLYTTTNIGTLLQNNNLSWYGFMESMPKPCYRSGSGEYAPRHNPFVYYADLVNTNLCKDHDVPLTNWTNMVNSDNIPNFSYISPNLLNDGHDTTVAYADNWLKGFLSPLINKSWFNNSVIFVTFDEGSTSAGFNGLTGGHIYTVAVSPFSKGMKVTNNVTHYNLLTTIEWLLNLGTTGHNDNPSIYPPMTGLFNFSGG